MRERETIKLAPLPTTTHPIYRPRRNRESSVRRSNWRRRDEQWGTLLVCDIYSKSLTCPWHLYTRHALRSELVLTVPWLDNRRRCWRVWRRCLSVVFYCFNLKRTLETTLFLNIAIVCHMTVPRALSDDCVHATVGAGWCAHLPHHPRVISFFIKGNTCIASRVRGQAWANRESM